LKVWHNVTLGVPLVHLWDHVKSDVAAFHLAIVVSFYVRRSPLSTSYCCIMLCQTQIVVILLLWYHAMSAVALVDLLLWNHITSVVALLDLLVWNHVTSGVAIVDFLLWYHATSDVAPCHLATVVSCYVSRCPCRLATVVSCYFRRSPLSTCYCGMLLR
jgi:hypothetical protein